MEINQAIALANELLVQHGLRPLSDVDCVILRGAWERQTYEEIAAATSYSVNYLRKDVGNKLWRDLATAIGEPLSKTNFKAALERRWEKKLPSSESTLQPLAHEYYSHRKTDWGEEIDVSSFLGRTKEQETLRQWIVADRCRFILILGMGGIGKTVLSIKVGQQVQADFEFVIWRSLRSAPPFLDLLADLIKVLSQQQDVQIPQTVDAAISHLLSYLKNYRCLLLLDNAESILQARDRKRSYRPDYEGYGQLFQRLCETPHLSCLMVTSRELPQGLEKQIGSERAVRSLTISGLLSNDGQALLESIAKFHGSTAEWEAILQRYAGNPLALKIVAAFINEILAGELSQFCAFLGESSFIFDDIRDLLDQQFQRLSSQEQAVMIWLALKREPVTLEALSEDLLQPIPPHELLQVMMALQSRAIVEKTKHQFTQQPVVMEYVTDYLIQQISDQICRWQVGDSIEELSVVRDYALIHLDSQEYVKETQSRLILMPITQRLLGHFGEVSHLEHHVQQVLAVLRGNPPQKMGYGSGNIINLLRALKVNLSGYDFSHLTLWQANLQGIPLHSVDFTGADFSKTLLTQNFGGIIALACHPDGQFLASGDNKGNIVLWRFRDEQPALILTGHKAWVVSLAFSSDGHTLVSGGIDYSVRLWDVQTGKCIRVMLGHESILYAVVFSPDNQKIASGGQDNRVKIWDTLTGECLQTLQGHTQAVRSIVFNPDGQHLITGSFDRTVRVWNIESGQTIHTLHGHLAPIWSTALSPNGEMVASNDADQTIRLSNTSTGECLSILQHPSDILSVAFHPNGLTLASTSRDQRVRVWDIKSGQCLHTLQGHTDLALAIAFHPNGKTLASGSLDQTIRLWDLETGQCTRVWHGYSHYLRSVAFSTDGATLASAGDDGIVRLWDWQQAKQLKSLTGHNSGLFTVAFHPNNRILATGGFDTAIWLWDMQTQQCLHQLKGMTEWTYSLAFHPDGQRLVSSSIVPLILFWDVNTGQCIQQFQGHSGGVWSVAFSPDGHQLASASADRSVKLWDIATGECLHTLTGHNDWLYAVKTFMPPSTENIINIESSTYRIASAGADRVIRIWDSQTGARLQILEGHTDWIYEIAVHPSGKYIASASHDATVRHWDLQTGECLAILPHPAPLWSVVYHPLGDLLASCGWNNRISIWDLHSGQIKHSLEVLKPYQGMIIKDCRGLTNSQLAMLQDLGAIA